MSTAAGQRRPFIALPGASAPLGYRNFALYWIGFSASNAGRWIELTGGVWLMYQLTGSPVLLGLLGVCRAVPSILFGPIAGVIADRVDQRRLLFTTQGLGLLASLCLGVLVATGQVQFWHVYVQVVLQAVIAAFDGAVRLALFPRLVPRAHLSEAVTLTAAGGRSAALIGPAIGGIAIARLGEAAPFLLNAATFLALMAAVIWMRGVAPRTPTPGSSLRGELTDGLRYVLDAPVLSGLLKLEIVFGIFQMNPVTITIIGREVLGVGPEGLGGLLAAPAFGGLIGIACMLVMGQSSQQGRFTFLCTFAYAGALAAFAISRDYDTALALLVVIGFLDSLVSVTRQSVMQLAAPARMRGRVMGNMATVTRGTSPLAQTQSGFLAAAIGAPLAVLAAAGALAIAAAAGSRTNAALWAYTRDEGHHEAVDLGSALSPPGP